MKHKQKRRTVKLPSSSESELSQDEGISGSVEGTMDAEPNFELIFTELDKIKSSEDHEEVQDIKKLIMHLKENCQVMPAAKMHQ